MRMHIEYVVGLYINMWFYICSDFWSLWNI